MQHLITLHSLKYLANYELRIDKKEPKTLFMKVLNENRFQNMANASYFEKGIGARRL